MLNNLNYSLKNLLQLDPSEVAKMNKQQLTKAVSVIRKSINAANKRLGKSDLGRLSPAYRSWLAEGKPSYRTKGLNQGQMQHVFAAARQARNRKTATVKGFAEYRKRVFEGDKNVAGGGYYGGSYESEKTYWELYNTLKDEYPEVPSNQIRAALDAAYAIAPEDPDKVLDIARDILSQTYERKEKERQEKQAEDKNFYDFSTDTSNRGFWDR